MNDVCVCVFAKAPVPGKVKTRLLPALTTQQACTVHENLLKHCVSRIQNNAWQSQLWSTDIEHSYINQCAAQYSMSLHTQLGDDLGERMSFAVRQNLKKFSYVILVGTDCPDLESSLIAEAIASLKEGSEAVLVPAEDGGYVLMGLSVHIENIFTDMQWGSDKVLAVTRDRLVEAGIRWQELSEKRDIDRPEDLDFLKQNYPALFIQ